MSKYPSRGWILQWIRNMFGSVAVHGAAEHKCIELPGIQFGCIKSILGISVKVLDAVLDVLALLSPRNHTVPHLVVLKLVPRNLD
ncbi:hypothetical protein KCU93_g419, partial [Aureobasidium melanogenum]